MTTSALLLSLLLRAAPPAAQAEALAAKGDAETLFLQYGAVKAEDYGDADRVKVAKALLKAAAASRKDAAIAVSLAEKAVALQKNAEGLTLLAEIESDLGQRSAAAEHLEEALKLDGKNLQALLARAALAETEHEAAVAVGLYERAVAAGGKAEVKAKLAKAKKAADEQKAAVAELKTTESGIKEKLAQGEANAAKAWVTSITKEDLRNASVHGSTKDGVRLTEVKNFTFEFTAGNRDSAELHDFEDKAKQLLEHAYDFVAEKLRYKLDAKTRVLLLSRQEFMAKYAGTREERAAGFWDGEKIVMNGGSALDEETAQVIVHEFTHAVIHAISSSSPAVPRWVNEGLAENMRLCATGAEGRIPEWDRAMLQRLSKEGRLPPLASLDANFIRFGGDVHVSYTLAAALVRIMIERRGYNDMVEMLREAGKAHDGNALVEKYFEPLEKIEQRLKDELG